MGGEHAEAQLADYPAPGKRLLRRGDQLDVYDVKDAKPMGPLK